MKKTWVVYEKKQNHRTRPRYWNRTENVIQSDNL